MRTDVPTSTAATFVGQAPAARVTVVVSLGTLLGEEHGVGEIPGYGYVSGAHARQLATARGSVWRRLVTDPVTGAALDLTTYRYRPTAAMATTIAALDGVCTAPGCTTAAHRCDVDHGRPWPAGPTAIANLFARDRRHHNHKTRGTWTATTDSDGVTLWRTCSGRSYLTGRHLRRPVRPTGHRCRGRRGGRAAPRSATRSRTRRRTEVPAVTEVSRTVR